MTGLVYEVISRQDAGDNWVRFVRDALAPEARAHSAEEMLRRQGLVGVLDALAAAGVQPISSKASPSRTAFTGRPPPGAAAIRIC